MRPFFFEFKFNVTAAASVTPSPTDKLPIRGKIEDWVRTKIGKTKSSAFATSFADPMRIFPYFPSASHRQHSSQLLSDARSFLA
jgi:hypothetical protein